MQGGEVVLGVAAQRGSYSVRREPIDPATGAPGGARAFPPVSGRSTHSPWTWPPGPGTFAAAGVSVANRFTLALALYTPSYERLSYVPAPDGQQPTRYHGVQIDLRNVALVPALALRVGNDLRIGLAPGFLFSTGRLVFDEDTALADPTRQCGGQPCQPEDPAAAARYDVGSGLGVFDSTLAFTVGGGIHYRRRDVEIGVSFTSRPLGNEGGGVEVNAERTTVTPPPSSGASTVCPPDRPTACVSAHLRYDLPDTFAAGVTWHLTPRTAITGIFRWLTFSLHHEIGIRLVGPASGGLRAAGLPEHIVLHRGFHDLVEGRVRLEHQFAPWLRVGAALRADNGAASRHDLSPIALAGPTLEPAAMAELRVGGWLRLTAGYAFTIMPTVETGASTFDPVAATTCARLEGDLLDPSCTKRAAGSARPTAAGRYGYTQHTGTLTALFSF
jgi:long-subunit fatty acid transport protein